MLGGTGLRRSAAAAATVRQRATLPIRSQRSLSSFATRTTQFRLRESSISPVNSFRRPAINYLPRLASARFNSTAAATASGASNANSTATTTAAGEPADTFNAIPDIADIDISQIPEKIGYLKELGLDYGWGPSAMIEFLLENIHIYTGIPWWGSVMATALLIRLALFYPTLQASDITAKMQEVKPILDPVRARMLAYAKSEDTVGAMREKRNAAMINEEYGIKPWKAFVPMLQIPIGFGCFRVMNGMSSLPVPALENEHFLWMTDLSLRDPTFLLPIATGAMLYYSMRRGGETGNNALTNTPFGRSVIIALPVISTMVTSFWPGLLQLYFFTSAICGAVQSSFIISPAFRKFAGLSPLPTGPPKGGSGSKDSKAHNRLRMMADQAAAQKAEAEAADPSRRVSFIDRAVNNLKSNTRELRKEAMSKMDEYAGTNNKNADGSPKAPPRRTKKEIDAANDYELKRREEAAWLREERNMQLREQYKKKPTTKRQAR